MRLDITGKNLAVSEALETRVRRKLGKMSRYFDDDVAAQVRLSVEKQRHIVEVTIPIRGGLLRAEEQSDSNMYAAIDAVCEKLERQVHRNRTRLEKKLKSSAFAAPLPEYSAEAYAMEDADYAIVKEKRFKLSLMSPEEAIAQMELLGHTFFLFLNQDTKSVCTVYRRNDGHYGLLIPEE